MFFEIHVERMFVFAEICRYFVYKKFGDFHYFLCSRHSFPIKHVLFIAETDAENQSYCQHIADHRASSIANERKRNSCYRQQANRHARILKHVKDKH